MCGRSLYYNRGLQWVTLFLGPHPFAVSGYHSPFQEQGAIFFFTHSPHPGLLANLVICFDQQKHGEIDLCKFRFSVLRGFLESTFAFLEPSFYVQQSWLMGWEERPWRIRDHLRQTSTKTPDNGRPCWTFPPSAAPNWMQSHDSHHKAKSLQSSAWILTLKTMGNKTIVLWSHYGLSCNR